MRPLALSLCLRLVLGVSAVHAASELPAPSVSAAEQSTLQRGTLSNGLRYAVLPQATEPGRISLRLIVPAGSLDEQDDELGFAHFVEHMAFNGTTHYPPGKLVEFFQRNGLAWGVDANADTSFTHTTYKIDLPAGHGDQLPEALQILRDFADGIAFASSEVKRERGVILSELTARKTNGWNVKIGKLSAVYQGSRVPSRIPLADAAAIKGSSAANLRAFYQRTYQPARMTLIAVGDINGVALVASLAEAFRSFKATQPLTEPAQVQVPAHEDLQAHVLADPNSMAASTVLASILPVSTDATTARLEDLADYVVLRALDRRLKERQRQLAGQLGAAGASRKRGIDGRYRHRGIEVQSRPDAWPAAVALIESELRRACENGFSLAEIREMTTSLLANARARRDAASRLSPKQLANDLADKVGSEQDWLLPEAELAEVEAWADRFTPEMATTALRSMFPDTRSHLLLTLRAVESVTPSALLAAYHSSVASPLPERAAASNEELRFRYDDFGPTGTIATRRTVPDLGLELVEFANGARLNVRASTTEPNHFKLVAHLGRGFADAPRNRPGLPFLAVNLLGVSDLNRHTRAELGRLIRMHAIDSGVTYASDRFSVNVEGPSTELPFALQFLSAFISDLKFEESEFPNAISSYTAMRAAYVGNSQSLSRIHLAYQLRAADPRFKFPPRSEVAGYSFAEVSEWTRATWLEGPIEVALAGDFEAQVAIDAAAATIGALPARREAVPIAAGERCEFPAKLYRNLTPAQMADRAATVQFAWAARDLASARSRRALRLAVAGLGDRLRVKLREELGATYSPIDGISCAESQPDFGFANIEITFDPKRAKKLSERVLTMADEMARKGLTAEEFSRARAPLIAQVAEDPLRNAWWLEHVLSRAQSQPTVLDDARTLKTDFESITLEEVNRAAATHYRFSNAHCVGIIPEAPSPKAPPPAQ